MRFLSTFLSFLLLGVLGLQASSLPQAILLLDRPVPPSVPHQEMLEQVRNPLARYFAFDEQLQAEQMHATAPPVAALNRIRTKLPEAYLFLLEVTPGTSHLIAYLPTQGVRIRALNPENPAEGVEGFASYLRTLEEFVPEVPLARARPIPPPAELSPEPLEEPSPVVEPRRSQAPASPAMAAIRPTPPASQQTLRNLKFTLAERQYNQEIWKRLKSQMMFFRQRDGVIPGGAVKLQLSIWSDGRILKRELLERSGSEGFDQAVLDSVAQMALPRPQAILVERPPYIVVIQINP